MKQKDGSVVNSYFNQESSSAPDQIYNQGLVFMLGQIEKIHFVDDNSNVSKKVVEYDVSVRDDRGGQSLYRNIKSASDLFGTNDFQETILESNEFAFSGKLATSNFFVNKNGTTVVIAHFNGNKDKPFIVAAFPHPKKTGAKRADGIRKLGEFRGFQWEINKLGEVILTYNGDRKPNGKLSRPTTGPTQIKIDKDGVFTLTDNENQLIRMDRVAKKIRIVTKENYEIVVGKDEIITIGGNKNESITGNETNTIQGNQSSTVQGNYTKTIQGTETTTTTGDRVHSAANHTLTGGGNIKIGSAGASENLVLGIQFMNLYNLHAHIGNLGVPTGTPIIQMDSNQLSLKNFTEH